MTATWVQRSFKACAKRSEIWLRSPIFGRDRAEVCRDRYYKHQRTDGFAMGGVADMELKRTSRGEGHDARDVPINT